jgi:hypothetical protein
MEKIWTSSWSAGFDDASIQLPTEPLLATLRRNVRSLPDKPAIVYYGRNVTVPGGRPAEGGGGLRTHVPSTGPLSRLCSTPPGR